MEDQQRRPESKVVAGNLSERECRLELVTDATEMRLAPDDSVVINLPEDAQVDIRIGYRADGMSVAVDRIP